MRSSPSILTVTPNPSVDVNTAVERVEPDRKLRCDEPSREAGGGGLNVARAVARLGEEVLAIWARGGPTGELLHGLLDREAVQHHPVRIEGLVRESFAVLERSSGRQFRFNTPGPTLPPDGLEDILDLLRGMRPLPPLVIGSGSLPPGLDERFYARLGECVTEAGARFILDTQGPPLRRALETRRLYLIKPNLGELRALVGGSLDDDRAIVDAARAIVEDGGSQVVVVSLGAAGALVVSAEGAERIVAPTVPVRSRIGAGDSTVGGIAVALARGESLRRAVRFGVSAGAAAVMTPGTELCRREDTERLFAQMQ